MEFYKEGKVIRIGNSQTLDLGDATYNHKGIIFTEISDNGGAGGLTLGVWFYNSGNLIGPETVPVYITVNNFTDIINPVRIAKVENKSGSTLNMILLN